MVLSGGQPSIKHIPEAQTWAIFQWRWKAVMLKLRACLGFAEWSLLYETLHPWPWDPQLPSDTWVFHCPHNARLLSASSLCASVGVWPLCGCTWPIRFHSYVLRLAILKHWHKVKLSSAVVFQQTALWSSIRCYCADNEIQIQHVLYWGVSCFLEYVQVYLN